MAWYEILILSLGIAAALILITALTVAAALYRFAIPRKKEQPPKEGELPFEQMMRKNKKDYYLPEVRAGVEFMTANRREAEEVYIDAIDGVRLHAALFRTERPAGLIVLCHGFHSSGEADFAPVIPFYLDKGYHVLLIDQRAHGRSGGKHLAFGVKERYDLRSWLCYAENRFPGLPLFASGISMGGATVAYALQLPDLPSSFCGALADCGYDSPAEEVAWFARHKFKLRFARFFIFFSDIYCRLFAHFSLYDCCTSRNADRITRPVMIIHGTLDDVVPFENGQRIYNALSCKKAFFVGKDALHGCSYLEESERFKAEVSRFLDGCAADYKSRYGGTR